jgi:hypothetical protein
MPCQVKFAYLYRHKPLEEYYFPADAQHTSHSDRQ